MVRKIFVLTEEQVQWILKEKQRTGAPMSEIIRRAIDYYRLLIEKEK